MAPIIIASTGRSGSTTLLRILNTLDGFNICGENHGMINDLVKFYGHLKETNAHPCLLREIPEIGRQKASQFGVSFWDKIKSLFAQKNDFKVYQKDGRLKPAWFNIFNFEKVRNDLIHLIETIYDAEKYRVWGFKEVRFKEFDSEGLDKLFSDYRELFPSLKVIVNYREDVIKQSVSGWYKNNPNAAQILEERNRIFKDFCNRNSSFCFLVSLENIVTQDNVFKKLFEFLGEKPDFDNINLVLADNK